jgi:ApeA N-terminal domain 1
LIETHAYRGLWWTPSDSDKKLNGTLTIKKGEPRLDVVGDFGHEVIGESEGERIYSMSLADQERVIGMTTDGKHVTLVDCTEVGGNMHFPGMPTAVYRARAALIGHGFEAGEPIELDEIEIRTSELEQWVGHVPFPAQQVDADDDGALVTVRVTRPQTIEIPLANGQRAQLRFEIHTSGLGIVTTDASLRYAAWIGLRFAERRELAGATHAVQQLRNFLSLAVGRPLTVLAVDGYRDDVVDKAGRRIPLQVLYPVARNPEPSARGVQPREMLFTFGEARDRIAEVLGAWLDHHALLDPVFALYFGTLYNASLYLEQRFTAYAQAIETYDRRRRPKAKERDPAEHKELIREILDVVPEQHRAWLKNELAFSNDLALADRLEHVLSACPNVTARIVGDQGVTAFVRVVKNTRNYYTHWDPAGKSKAATEPRDLYGLTLQLRTVLETVFLLELDFECERIEAVLQRARRFEEIDLQR